METKRLTATAAGATTAAAGFGQRLHDFAIVCIIYGGYFDLQY